MHDICCFWLSCFGNTSITHIILLLLLLLVFAARTMAIVPVLGVRHGLVIILQSSDAHAGGLHAWQLCYAAREHASPSILSMSGVVGAGKTSFLDLKRQHWTVYSLDAGLSPDLGPAYTLYIEQRLYA